MSDAVVYPRLKEASSCLKKHNWRLDAAIDAYYSGPGASGNPAKAATDPATMERRIVELFNKYKGISANHFRRHVSDSCTFDLQNEIWTRSQSTVPSNSVKI